MVGKNHEVEQREKSSRKRAERNILPVSRDTDFSSWCVCVLLLRIIVVHFHYDKIEHKESGIQHPLERAEDRGIPKIFFGLDYYFAAPKRN